MNEKLLKAGGISGIQLASKLMAFIELKEETPFLSISTSYGKKKPEINSEAAMKVERTILLGAQKWGQFEKFWLRKHPA